MATPRAAEHRDMEQRFRNLEQQVRDLNTAVLSRKPVWIQAADGSQPSGWTPPAGWSDAAGPVVNVPSGYTRALVVVTAQFGAPWATGHQSGVSPLCNGDLGVTVVESAGAAASTSVFVLDGVTDQITLGVRVYRTSALAGSCSFHLRAGVVLLRTGVVL